MEGVNRYFTTGVGLVTSTGKHGSNVMAVEWTMHMSYEPMLIAIFIHEGSATYENIMETKEFGVNMSTDEQATLVSIAGSYSRTEIDKLSLKYYKTYPARCIKAPMIKGCIINAECILVNHFKLGDHVAVIGEVIDAKFDKTKSPLIYHQGRYRKIGKELGSDRKVIRVSKTLFSELKRMGKNAFTMRCAAAIIRNNKGETLLIRNNGKLGGKWSIPWLVVKRGSDHASALSKYLNGMDLDVEVKTIINIERLLFKQNLKQLRANFAVYQCSANEIKANTIAKWHKRIPKDIILKNLLIK